MNTIERARFVKLIEFLEGLESEKFDFSMVVAASDEAGCGTVCCVIGWTPRVFPEFVTWGAFGELDIKGNHAKYEEVASQLFGMDEGLAGELFAPGGQGSVHDDLEYCGYDASPQQVAAMLLDFLRLVDAGKIDPSFDPTHSMDDDDAGDYEDFDIAD